MQQFSISPREMFASQWRNFRLARTLIRREVAGRYRGSIVGLFWSFLNPVFMLVIYTFVFGVVFKARWNATSDSKLEFALVLFAGLLVFNFFAECVNRAPGLILSNANYVKKVVFPLEILPSVIMGAAFFHTLVSLIVWMVVYAIFFGLPSVTVFLLPVVLLPLMFFTMGISWFLASLGVYLRDAGQVIGILTTALLFLSPVFYPITAWPEAYQPFLLFNPLTLVIEQARNVLIWGQQPDWIVYGSYLAASVLISWLGFAWFQMTRKGFADVL